MSEKITLIAILVMLSGFIATKAIGGIISEYAKRFWFQKLEPMITSFISRKDLEKPPVADHEATALNELVAEVQNLRAITENALLDRDYWHAEAMRLRIESINPKAA